MKKNLSIKSLFYFPVLLFFLCYLLVFPQESLYAARAGLLLWFQTVLPTLFPFLVLSNLMIQTHAASYITYAVSPFLSKIFHVSSPGSYCILCGFLFGYPMGAKTICDLHRLGEISTKEASRLMLFCNHLSPMFLTGFVAALLPFPASKSWVVVLIVFFSPILGLMLSDLCSFVFFKDKNDSSTAPEYFKKPSSSLPHLEKLRFSLIDASIFDAFETIVKLGGYIILFSILSSIPLRIFPGHPAALALACVMEVTVGLSKLSASQLPLPILFPGMMALCCFGGFSAFAQTASFLQKENLSSLRYFKSKIVAAILAATMSVPLLHYTR